MRFLKALLLSVSFLALAATANAQAVLSVAAGAQGIWYDGGDVATPDDFELGGSGSLSLSPHIAAVGGVYYGVDGSYLRSTVGGRFTVTDANDQNIGAGIGIEFQASGHTDRAPQEWLGTASVAYRPYGERLPRVFLVGQAAYGFDTHSGQLVLGLRYLLSSTGVWR